MFKQKQKKINFWMLTFLAAPMLFFGNDVSAVSVSLFNRGCTMIADISLNKASFSPGENIIVNAVTTGTIPAAPSVRCPVAVAPEATWINGKTNSVVKGIYTNYTFGAYNAFGPPKITSFVAESVPGNYNISITPAAYIQTPNPLNIPYTVCNTSTSYTCPNGGALSGTTCTYGATMTGGILFDTPATWCTYTTMTNVNGTAGCGDPASGYVASKPFSWGFYTSWCSPQYDGNGQVTWQCATPGNSGTPASGYVSSKPFSGGFYTTWCKPEVSSSGNGGDYVCAEEPGVGYVASSSGTYGGTYTCPNGGTLSGATCTYPATQVAACTPPSSTLIKNAQFISYADVPATATTGQVFTASITMKNTGDATWLQGDYRLSSIGNSWGTTSVALTRNVAKGETYTFTQAFIAPDVVGTYNFQWQMLVGVTSTTTLFGDATTNQQITVNATPTSAVNGACGTANNTTTYPAPSAPSALCSVGPASIVSTPDVWNWTCAGFFGGSSASCMAKCDPAYQSYDCISVPAASCDQSNAGKTIVTTTARCIGVDPVNSCTSPDFPTLQDCADALVTCPADTTTTCPAPLKIDSWKEVAP